MKDNIILYFDGEELHLSKDVLKEIPALIVWDEKEDCYVETEVATFEQLRAYDLSYIKAKEYFIQQYNKQPIGYLEIPERYALNVAFDKEKNTIYAGGATNAGVIREYEIDVDYDLSVDENMITLYNKIVESAT